MFFITPMCRAYTIHIIHRLLVWFEQWMVLRHPLHPPKITSRSASQTARIVFQPPFFRSVAIAGCFSKSIMTFQLEVSGCQSPHSLSQPKKQHGIQKFMPWWRTGSVVPTASYHLFHRQRSRHCSLNSAVVHGEGCILIYNVDPGLINPMVV